MSENLAALPATVHPDQISRSEQICKLIIAAILRGELGDNRKLPTELELAGRYAASRTTIREALARLRSEGVVVSRRGSGNYVQRLPSQAAPARAQIESIHDVERYYTFRLCVEVGAAEVASSARDDHDIAALRTARQSLNQAQQRGGTGVEEDLALHMAIARASHNPFFISTIEYALSPIRQCMELAQNLGRPQGAEHIATLHDEHDDIVEAIFDGSPQRAGAAMRRHIEHARLRIFEGA